MSSPTPKYGYLDTSVLVSWAESKVKSPTSRDEKIGLEVDRLLQGSQHLSISELVLLEFRSNIAKKWRNTNQECREFDAEWAAVARHDLMKLVADGDISVEKAPPRAPAHAMTLVDLAASEYGIAAGMWDTIHLITACALAYRVGEKVAIYTGDTDYDKFVKAFPHFLAFVDVVYLSGQ